MEMIGGLGEGVKLASMMNESFVFGNRLQQQPLERVCRIGETDEG